MGGILLLDDFTEENGATWMLPKSQTLLEEPEEKTFYKKAKRIIAKAGSAVYFNSRLWHSSDINRTSSWRHALTINMCRPWMKQRIDIPRAMGGIDLSMASEKVLQKLGFHSQIPASYSEYFVEPEKRKFKQTME